MPEPRRSPRRVRPLRRATRAPRRARAACAPGGGAELSRPRPAASGPTRGRARRDRRCPATTTQVAAYLEACAREGVAVVPFGGGTSVVGGVEPLRGRAHARCSRSTCAACARRERGPSVDDRHPRRRPARARGRGGSRRAGVTLGHFPQSFELATIGGYAATRSAGQASSGYGRFDELVTSLRMVTPAGSSRRSRRPAHGRGPGAARARPGLRGHAGRDHVGHGEGAARARRAGATRGSWSRTSRRRRGAPASLRSATPCRT